MDFQALVKFALICFDSHAWPLFAWGYPLRASIQAIETNSDSDTRKLVTYWIIFSLISLFEHAFMGILQWLPFWPYMKLMVVCWTMIPRFDGAFYVYNRFVHPCMYMDSPSIITWFKKLQVFFLNNFLAKAADEYVKVHTSPEALEKPIANQPNGTEPSILQEDIKPVRAAEEREVAPVKPIPATESIDVQTVNDAVTLLEINGEAGFDLPEIPSDKQVQKEWTCAVCQVKVTCEKTLNTHLQGRKHKNACERLKRDKNQPGKGEVGSDSAVKEPSKDGSSSNASACCKAVNRKTKTSKCYLPIEESKKSEMATNVAGNQVKPSENIQGQQQVGKEHGETKIPQFRCTICNVTCGRLEDLNCHLWGRKHLEKVQKLSKGQISAAASVAPKSSVGKEHGETKIPQFRCTICSVTCSRSEDLNCHLWGRKHLAQIQKLSEGQVPAVSSVAPKSTDIPNNNASACYEAVNPKTETSKCYLPMEDISREGST